MSSDVMLSDVPPSTVALSTADQDQGVVLSPVLTRHPDWLHVALSGPRCRYSLRCGGDDVAALGEIMGAQLPRKIGETVLESDLDILCLGPDEWMAICGDKRGRQIAKNLGEKAGGTSYALVDISHRNIAFALSGSVALQILNVGCPRDLSAGAFPVGRCTRTVFEHAQIVIVREDEARFKVEIWRSFAPYLAEYFAVAARGLGSGKF